MSLITCPECQNTLSRLAAACPKCGWPNPDANVPGRAVSFGLGFGILLFPMIFAWLTLRKGYSTAARIVSFLWLFAGMMLWISMVNSPAILPADPLSEAGPPPASDQPSPAMRANLSDLISAYDKNEVNADIRYKGKRLQVSGRVSEIKRGLIGEGLYITLDAGNSLKMTQFQAFFDEGWEARLGRLKQGSTVTVECEISGLLFNVGGQYCVLK